MRPLLIELEGTWAEITAHLPDFGERRLHVIVRPVDERDATADAQQPESPVVAALREIAARSGSMHPRPDARDHLREARAGAMFGYEPTE